MDHANQNDFVVTLTGAAGNIGSIVMFLLAAENIFGEQHRIVLRLIDLPAVKSKLDGLAMELDDCQFSRLRRVEVLPEATESFRDSDCVILVAGKPRTLGMERRDLLIQNAELFRTQAELCKNVLKPSAKVLIVANPCNTNALIFSHFSPNLPAKNITALSWLDQARAKALIAHKLDVNVQRLKNVCIVGNHSNTLVVDVSRGLVEPEAGSSEAPQYLRDLLDAEFRTEKLQTDVKARGGEIIKTKGTSSSFSAAKAIVDHLKNWYLGSNGEVVSMAVLKDGLPGADGSLCIALPVVCRDGGYEIARDALQGINKQEEEMVKLTIEELVAEKQIAFEMF